MLNGMKAKALLIGTMALSVLISGCGVKKDSDDKVRYRTRLRKSGIYMTKKVGPGTQSGTDFLLDTL